MSQDLRQAYDGDANVLTSPIQSISATHVTFTNVPVGSGYTIKAWRCAASNPKSGTLTNQTVNAPTTNINLVFSTNTCPLP
jgi:hypothetical protein